MNADKTFSLAEAHLEFAKQANGKTWELLMKAERTPEEDQEMLAAAYTSGYHWHAAGTPLNHQRAEWLIAHVFTVLRSAELALPHAQNCQSLTETHPDLMKDFDLAYAAEGLARAHALSGNLDDARQWKAKARQLGDKIQDAEDKKIFDGDFNSGGWFGA